jgi:DNA-binding response OmpR family regulator
MAEQKLRDRIFELEEEIVQLKNALLPPDNPFVGKFNLPPQQLGLLYALYKSEVATFGRLDCAMNQSASIDRSTEDTLVKLRIKVGISKLRQDLSEYDIRIVNHRGVGYALDAESRSSLAEVLKLCTMPIKGEETCLRNQ